MGGTSGCSMGCVIAGVVAGARAKHGIESLVRKNICEKWSKKHFKTTFRHDFLRRRRWLNPIRARRRFGEFVGPGLERKNVFTPSKQGKIEFEGLSRNRRRK